ACGVSWAMFLPGNGARVIRTRRSVRHTDNGGKSTSRRRSCTRCNRLLVSKTRFAQMDVHVDETGGNDQTLGVDLGDFGLRIVDCGLIGDSAAHDYKIADFITPVRRIDDAAIANDG